MHQTQGWPQFILNLNQVWSSVSLISVSDKEDSRPVKATTVGISFNCQCTVYLFTVWEETSAKSTGIKFGFLNHKYLVLTKILVKLTGKDRLQVSTWLSCWKLFLQPNNPYVAVYIEQLNLLSPPYLHENLPRGSFLLQRNSVNRKNIFTGSNLNRSIGGHQKVDTQLYMAASPDDSGLTETLFNCNYLSISKLANYLWFRS